MKRYRAIEVILTTNHVEPPAQDDFGKAAAIAHRIDKGSWEGSKTKSHGFKELLGKGGFKTVYQVGSVAPKSLEFVLAKLIVQKQTEELTKKCIRTTMTEVISMMYLYGLARMTVWITGVEKEYREEFIDDKGVRMVIYLPRIAGQDLHKRIAKNPHAIDLNLRIRWFNQVYSQLKELHFGRLYMGDFKPANIMVDDVLGASIIDFGGLRRPWLWPTCTTRIYSLSNTDPEVHAHFMSLWKNSVGTSLDGLFSGYISTDLRVYAKSAAAAITSRPDNEKREYNSRKVNGYDLGLYGIHHDMFSLSVTALEMGLVNSSNEGLFRTVLANHVRPYHMEQFVNHLRASYTGDPALLDKPSSFHPLTSVNGVIVRPAVNSTLDPDALTAQLVRKELAIAEQEVRGGAITALERDARAQSLNVFEDAMKVFRVLSTVSSVYQVAGGVGGRNSVDTKHQVMTALINQLTWTITGDQLRDTLTRILAASLVNRSLIAKDITRSFEALVNALKRSNDLLIIQTRWSPQLTSSTPLDNVREIVINKALLLDGGVAEHDAFKKKHLNERLLHLVDAAVATGPTHPATRAQVVEAIDRMLATSKASITSSPLKEIANIRLAGQANRLSNLSSSENIENEKWAVIAGHETELSFMNVLGNESAASIDAYNTAVNRLYSNPT